jgi:hypothetical protein
VFGDNKLVFACFNECALPNNNWGAFFIFVKWLFTNLQVFFLLFFFWWLPRKFTIAQMLLKKDDEVALSVSFIRE